MEKSNRFSFNLINLFDKNGKFDLTNVMITETEELSQGL